MPNNRFIPREISTQVYIGAELYHLSWTHYPLSKKRVRVEDITIKQVEACTMYLVEVKYNDLDWDVQERIEEAFDTAYELSAIG